MYRIKDMTAEEIIENSEIIACGERNPKTKYMLVNTKISVKIVNKLRKLSYNLLIPDVEKLWRCQIHPIPIHIRICKSYLFPFHLKIFPEMFQCRNESNQNIMIKITILPEKN